MHSQSPLREPSVWLSNAWMKNFLKQLTESLEIPTIGIGSGKGCDGQILVIHDLLGLTSTPPPFVKPEAQLHRDAVAAVQRWAKKTRKPGTKK
jgi:ketopantoate hydroxymethyltransferase